VEGLVASHSPDWRLPQRVPADVAAALPGATGELEQALRPAERDLLAAMIAKLLLHYWTPDMPPGHYDVLAEAWIEDLAEYPVAVVAEAALQWRRTEKWSPRICELRGLCDELLARHRRELLRLRFLEACVARHGGQVPVLARRVGERLIDYADRPTDRDLEAWLRGEHDVGADRVWTLPAEPPAALPPP
jgi:hypothetical protein